MPRNGSGVYNLPSGINPVVPNTTITSEWANNTLTDIAAALSQSLARDGQTSPVANLPMGGFRHTNVSDPSARNQYASLGWVQDGFHIRATSVGGTNDIFAQLIGGSTVIQTGQILQLTNVNTNTGPVTLNLNSIGAKQVVRPDGTDFPAGQFVAGTPYILIYDGTKWICANLPAVRSIDIADATGISFSGGPITESGTFVPELSVTLQAWNGINPDSKANVAGQTFTGPIIASGVTSQSGMSAAQNFASTTPNAVLGGDGSGGGGVFLRPNGVGSTVGQTFVQQNGILTVTGTAITDSPRINLIPGAANATPGVTFHNNLAEFRGGVYWDGPTDSVVFYTSSDGTNPRMRLENSGRLATTSGYSMGSNVAASPVDLSKHIALWGTTFGFSITSLSVNVVSNGVLSAQFLPTGLAVPGAFSAGGNATVAGAITANQVFDSLGNLRKIANGTVNANTTATATWLNAAIEKSNDSTYAFTIPAGLGSTGDAITLVNSGTAGVIDLTPGPGVTFYKSGISGNIVIPAGSIVTIYHSATANRWIA